MDAPPQAGRDASCRCSCPRNPKPRIDDEIENVDHEIERDEDQRDEQQ
jgi:hypothetical protein